MIRSKKKKVKVKYNGKIVFKIIRQCCVKKGERRRNCAQGQILCTPGNSDFSSAKYMVIFCLPFLKRMENHRQTMRSSSQSTKSSIKICIKDNNHWIHHIKAVNIQSLLSLLIFLTLRR